MRVPAGFCGLDLTRPWKFRMDQDGEKQQGKKVNTGGRCETMGTPQFGTVFSSKDLVIRHLKNKLQGWHLVFFFSPRPRHRILSSICTSGRAVWFSVRCRCSMLEHLPGSVMLISAIMGTTQVAKQESWRVAARWNPWDVWVLLVLRSSICLQMHLQRWTSELCKMVRYRGSTSDLEPNSPTTLHILSHMNYDVALIHTRSITIPSPSKIKKRV